MQLKVMDKSEFPMDAKSDGIIVMPVNLQGLMEFGAINRRFRHEFPETYKKYVKECIKGEVYAGEVKVFTEGKFTIALLFYKNFEVGQFAAQQDEVKLDTNLIQCLGKLFNKYGDGTKFYSPVLPFKGAQVKIIHSKLEAEWVVIQEDGIV